MTLIGDAYSHPVADRAADVIDPAVPIMMCERRARQREHWHFAKMPQITRALRLNDTDVSRILSTHATTCQLLKLADRLNGGHTWRSIVGFDVTAKIR